ncbi:MAG: carbohydrate-binding family 9-like protein [Verrucomicrobia bacterium]|nr:carbohydrate-binding family 9-like protein [Verrucomicrobiota bacterium]MCG2678508.1 carbohydrate-binding family 9-like protein [Kiritimatiellia bacterium]MBU4248014.1 carbohydrate-binding family 9-like protein [Verrucomicrobiota bacterium]MBU4289548.1 carbohydrate-binding family 9-like protein [Verrucomicrobiota bacterium]MBU4427753.1 carbohydrate-binding family 9-like protein [Verrucomicrobiota bacterium]
MKNVMEYVIRRASATPSLLGKWLEPAWRDVPVARIRHFHKKSSCHHPQVEAKLTYTIEALHVFFRVQDRYIRSTRTDFQASVCKDSCVEFFIQPKPDKGYLNFEINCGGTLLVYYIEDSVRTKDGYRKGQPLSRDLAQGVRIFHSMPAIVYPEIAKKRTWFLEYSIPFALFEALVGRLGVLKGQRWRGNLYKCADESSRPHWASWAPIGSELNFHQPKYFAPFRFQ